MHGYSSSEESDDPRRPRNPPPAATSTTDQKKKKKKKLPPQKSINHIWKKFSKRKFHTALSVLPFDPVQPPAISNQPNELLSVGYEKAAGECRRKVEKIIKECKRVNARYRDPGFNIDWDLKYEKGHCLNYLGYEKFELNRTTLLSSKSIVPKAVKRVHEIFENPTFLKNPSGADVVQGALGDCWIMASLTAIANTEDGIKRICVAYDTKIGIYGFVFYRDGEWIYSIIDDKLYLKSPCWDSPSMQRDLLQQIDREDVESVYRKTYQTGSKALFFAQNKDQNETWLPLAEKAYAKAHGDYASLSGGWIGEGIEDATGGVTTELLTSDILDIDHFWDKEMSRVNKEFLFGASTGLEHGYGYGERNGIAEGHAYIVMAAHTLKSGQRLVKLRNPWGKIRKGLWEGPWSDGSKEWTAEAQEELDHKFGSDSVFWISYEDLIRKFSHFDRTRLFRDPDWRCCQRWIGVDVPWKAEYHEKFHIKLTEDSPLVLVLSQLDKRYFKGLHGQYRFRLHFRLHDLDRPDAEDYIVRSHQAFMDRSVSVELPDMPAGTYVVYLRVAGERNGDLSSVEDVVKRECADRVANEKLAQVGYAYDLAHSKAWDHIDKVAKLRQRKEQQKASGCRQDERRHQWEKRRVTREVNRKQKDKNAEKKRRRREVWEAAQDAKEKAEREARELADQEARELAEKEAKELAEKQAKELAEKEARDLAEKEAKKADDEASSSTDKSTQEDSKAEDDTVASDSSGSPQLTPKSEDSTVDETTEERQEVPPVSGAPPPPASTPETPEVPETPPAPESPVQEQAIARPVYDDANDSSDSPVSDWEELYSSDDMCRKPRTTTHAPLPRDDYDTEEEKMPDPWNAICIVGIRVYSKNARLELRTVMEGGQLLEDGMGEKGAADLDNAQSNAAGTRADENKEPASSKTEGELPYNPLVRKDGGAVDDEHPSERNSMIKRLIHIDSTDSTRMNTPEPTPLESNKRLESQV